MLKYYILIIFLVKTVIISCEEQHGSLTFVLDSTSSMNKDQEIELVKNATNRFMDIVLLKNTSRIKDVVIVTFNDPEHLTQVVVPKTRDRNKIKEALNNIKTSAGGDCEEYSLSGISKALQESRRNSYLFVFTEAAPKDGHVSYKIPGYQYIGWRLDKTKLSKKVSDVKKLAQSKGSQVFFFLTNRLCFLDRYKPYWDIADATNGLVFNLTNKNDLTEVLPFVDELISGGDNTIARVIVPAHKHTYLPFSVDNQTEYVVVSASSSVLKVDLNITKGPTREFQKISWNDKIKILKINNPAPGSYEASVLGTSDTTVLIFGRTDFTFQHGFSVMIPPIFSGDIKQPIYGIKSYLLIKVDDPTQSVNIMKVLITSPDGSIIHNDLTLKKESDNYYTTDSFLPQKSLFLITVIGVGKITGKEIKRSSKTPIESIRQEPGPPRILSDEGKLYTAVEGDFTLRIPCVAVGDPKPVITWTPKSDMDNEGTLIIKNPRVGDSKQYTCKASNKFGSVVKTFEAYVTEYIDDDSDAGDVTFVDLLSGEMKQINCSSGSSKGRWYKEWYPMNLKGTLTIEKADKYLNSGNYTCRISDITGSKSHTYIVEVGYPPQFNNHFNESIDWKGRDPQQISCSAMMRPSTRTAKAELLYNGKATNFKSGIEALNTIYVSSFDISWGNYTCKMSNIHGQATKTIHVYSSGCVMKLDSTVSKSPLVLNTRGKWPHLDVALPNLFIPHKQDLLLSCHKDNSFHKFPQKSEIIATCDHEDNFIVDGNTYKSSDLQCNFEVTPVFENTGEKCLFENTEYVKVGYNVQYPGAHFLEVYRVCFDKTKKLLMYSESNVTLLNEISLKNISWQEYGQYYNEKIIDICADGSNCCLKSYQLVNNLDVVPGKAQLATFIEGLNTVPYWSKCKAIHDTWVEIESKIRKHVKKPYRLFSGAHKYSEVNGIMVPRYLWKVVKVGKASLVIVKVNDPSPTTEDILCDFKCIAKWMPKLEDKYTYCCTLDEFQTKFIQIPDV